MVYHHTESVACAVTVVTDYTHVTLTTSQSKLLSNHNVHSAPPVDIPSTASLHPQLVPAGNKYWISLWIDVIDKK